MVAELRSSVAGDDDGSKKLTHQERSSRMDAWPISGALEPSNALVDAAFVLKNGLH